MVKSKHSITYAPEKSDSYKEYEQFLSDAFFNGSIPEDEKLENCFLYLTTQHLKRTLFFYEIYKKIVNVSGVAMHFGCRWGRHVALFESLRTIFEPFNFSRTLIGFDTFSGFPDQFDANKDKAAPQMKAGYLATSEGFEKELERIMHAREQLAPMGHVKKYEIIKGDVSKTFPEYMQKNPHTVVAFAHLDVNVFEPTKICLELLKKHVTKGSIIAIDEVSYHEIPGQTLALQEVFGLSNIRLERMPMVNPAWPAYFTVE